MPNSIPNNYESDSAAPSLLIAAHCLTIVRKAARFDSNELSAILNDFVRELNSNNTSMKVYLNSLNEIVKTLNSNFPAILVKMSSNYFFVLIRNTIRNLLQQYHTTNQLDHQEIYVLRNCTVLIHRLVEKIKDVSKILHWITDGTFLDALGNCLNHLNKSSKANENPHLLKQITRLLDIFCNIQERLPANLHQSLFVRLFQPTINCLISSNYTKLFKAVKSNAHSLTPKEKLYLVKCPHFLIGYNGKTRCFFPFFLQ